MDSVYHSAVAERFQRITPIQGAAWLSIMVLQISHVLMLFQGSPRQILYCHNAASKAQFLFILTQTLYYCKYTPHH